MKIAIIRGRDIASWASCQTIISGLEILYRQSTFKESLTLFSCDHKATLSELVLLAQEIALDKPEKIILLDYLPSPGKIITAITMAYRDQPIPPIVCHLYGDFILRIGDWRDLVEKKLLNIKLLCASRAQAGLVQKVFGHDQNLISVFPFPVEKNLFNFSPSTRDQERKRLGIENNFVFLYAGRLSVQKNVLELIKAFKSFQEKFGSQAKLLLAGPFDDLGVPYLGESYLSGYYQQLIVREVGLDNSIKYVGNLSLNDLGSIMNAADCFISLSTHNDEDFGMAPLQALCTGLPAILSRWGGYADFSSDDSDTVALIPVKFNDMKPEPDYTYLQKIMFQMVQRGNQNTSRKRFAEMYNQKYSTDHLTSRLNSLLVSRGGTIQVEESLFYRTVAVLENSIAPFRSRGSRYTPLYEALYASYWSARE